MNSFSSKILLLGEHIVNKGAHALAIPYDKFYASLSYNKDHEHFLEPSSLILNKLLVHIQEDDVLKSIYDLARLSEDISKGLGFLLNIPVGYGLGSSGAIVAAIFDEYALDKTMLHDELKQILGATEGVFHGKSSGLDPLVSYLNQAVLIKENTNIIEAKLEWRNDFSIFLVDTLQARKTGPLVEAFLKKATTDEAFIEVLNKEIIPLNNSLVNNFVSNKHENSMSLLKHLSSLQLAYMSELILPEHLALWRKGLEDDTYYLKICGAGGGGFMLGFTKNRNQNFDFNLFWI